MSTSFQKQLLIDKLAGFDACNQFIKSDGYIMARARARADILTNEQANKDLGFWRGWVHALLNDSAVGI